MNFMYILATIAFVSVGVIFTGMFIADLLNWISENFSDDITEIPADTAEYTDKFENLYINVANGDIFDREYWLKAVKGEDF